MLYRQEQKMRLKRRSRLNKPKLGPSKKPDMRALRKMHPMPDEITFREDLTFKPERLGVDTEALLASLVKNSELHWISNSKRQANYIQSQLTHEFGDLESPEEYLQGLTTKEVTTLKIDLLNANLEKKVSAIRRMEWHWANQLEQSKALDWFKTDTDRKLSAFNDHLKKARYPELIRRPTLKDTDEIGILYDDLALDNKAHLFETALLATKRLHQKRTYNERNTDKKQCNVMLPTELIRKLDKKAAKRNIKRSQLIFEILEEASRK